MGVSEVERACGSDPVACRLALAKISSARAVCSAVCAAEQLARSTH